MSSSSVNTSASDIRNSSILGSALKSSSFQGPDAETAGFDILKEQAPHSIVQERLVDESCNSATVVADPEDIFLNTNATSPFNPGGEKFNARIWAKAVASLATKNGQDFRRIGLCFQDLNVFGYGTAHDFQKDVANVWLALPSMARRLFSGKADQHRIDILRDFDGIIKPGEMCVVLGPPGSGCSTFLKTIAGVTSGIYVNKTSYLNYNGIAAEELHSAHRGDIIYTAEVDVHFPKLTVGETLTFAAHARCQRLIPEGISRNQYVFILALAAATPEQRLTNVSPGTVIAFGTSSWPCTALVTPLTPQSETNSFGVFQEENVSVSQSPKQPCHALHYSAGISESSACSF